MGRAWFRFGEFNNTCVDIIGKKAGLALTYNELVSIMPKFVLEDFKHLDHVSNMRAEEFDEVMCKILFELGHFSDPDPLPPLMRLPLKWKEEGKGSSDIYSALIDKFEIENKKQYELIAKDKQSPVIDPTPFLEFALIKFGRLGFELAQEMCLATNETLERSFFSPVQKTAWKDVIELKDLFESQKLATQHGTFFDQRFINYLAKNHGDISKINWRKFEGLTCEFFQREGFEVEIGPGRNDDGIDARIWPKDGDKTKPPHMIIQCKRQKEQIEKVQVKSLYADVLHTKAKTGLIVTTSTLSPGAKLVCDVRDYPIKEINGEKVKQWLIQMRTPGKGSYSFEE